MLPPLRAASSGLRRTSRCAIESKPFEPPSRCAHHKGRIAHRAGHREGPFPFGTYAMRTVHGATVETQPCADAIDAAQVHFFATCRHDYASTTRGRSIGLLVGPREQVEEELSRSTKTLHAP